MVVESDSDQFEMSLKEELQLMRQVSQAETSLQWWNRTCPILLGCVPCWEEDVRVFVKTTVEDLAEIVEDPWVVHQILDKLDVEVHGPKMVEQMFVHHPA